MEKAKSLFKKLSKSEKIYAGTMIPVYISFTIYMLIGVPLIMP